MIQNTTLKSISEDIQKIISAQPSNTSCFPIVSKQNLQDQEAAINKIFTDASTDDSLSGIIGKYQDLKEIQKVYNNDCRDFLDFQGSFLNKINLAKIAIDNRANLFITNQINKLYDIIKQMNYNEAGAKELNSFVDMFAKNIQKMNFISPNSRQGFVKKLNDVVPYLKILQDGKDKGFNFSQLLRTSNPLLALTYAEKYDNLNDHSPEGIASYIMKKMLNQQLSSEDAGIILYDKGHSEVLSAFIRQFNFKNLSYFRSLCTLFETLPSKIENGNNDKVLDQFTDLYCQQNSITNPGQIRCLKFLSNQLYTFQKLNNIGELKGRKPISFDNWFAKVKKMWPNESGYPLEAFIKTDMLKYICQVLVSHHFGEKNIPNPKKSTNWPLNDNFTPINFDEDVASYVMKKLKSKDMTNLQAGLIVFNPNNSGMVPAFIKKYDFRKVPLIKGLFNLFELVPSNISDPGKVIDEFIKHYCEQNSITNPNVIQSIKYVTNQLYDYQKNNKVTPFPQWYRKFEETWPAALNKCIDFETLSKICNLFDQHRLGETKVHVSSKIKWPLK